MVHASWWYYFSKFTEFFDTVSKIILKYNKKKKSINIMEIKIKY